MNSNIKLLGAGMLIIGALFFVGAAFYDAGVNNKAPPKIQHITCIYGNYLTFSAENIYFQRFTGESVEFKDIEGNVVSYKLREGEYCGWQPAVTPNQSTAAADPKQYGELGE